MTNFLKETKLNIESEGNHVDNIVYIDNQSGTYSCDWNRFESLADFEYDSGFGSQKIATDLIIVFANGDYMDRYEYDGSECWSYHTTPKIFPILNNITSFGGDFHMWDTLKEIHDR